MLVGISKMAFLLLYLIVVSQGIFYLLAARKAFSVISLDVYAQIRNSIDQVIERRLKVIYPATVLMGIIVILFLSKAPDSLIFITTVIALFCVVVDLVLAIKVNIPINAKFHTYSSGMQGVDWELLRRSWLQFIKYRAVLQVIGFLALLLGMNPML